MQYGKLKIIFLVLAIAYFSNLVLAQDSEGSAFGMDSVDLGVQGKPIGQLVWTLVLASGGMLLAAEFIGKRASAIGAKVGSLIGVTLVAVMSSRPEFAISIMGAMSGQHGIVIGNAIGSNIVNIALVLGVATILKPAKVEKGAIRTLLPLLVIIFAVIIMYATLSFSGGFSYELSSANERMIGRDEGILLILSFFVFMLLMHLVKGVELKGGEGGALGNMILLLVGVGFLVLTAKVTVDAMLALAAHYQVSGLLVGATLMAIGTSLPELAITSVFALKGEHDLMFGNLVMSNVFDISICLGAAALITAIAVERTVFLIHIPFMILLNIFVLFMVSRGEMDRKVGIILIILYVIYLVIAFGGGLASLPFF